MTAQSVHVTNAMARLPVSAGGCPSADQSVGGNHARSLGGARGCPSADQSVRVNYARPPVSTGGCSSADHSVGGNRARSLGGARGCPSANQSVCVNNAASTLLERSPVLPDYCTRRLASASHRMDNSLRWGNRVSYMQNR